jgi:hypothetical protein
MYIQNDSMKARGREQLIPIGIQYAIYIENILFIK